MIDKIYIVCYNKITVTRITVKEVVQIEDFTQYGGERGRGNPDDCVVRVE